MINKFFKYFSIITAPMFIVALVISLRLSKMPDTIYVNEKSDLSQVYLEQDGLLNKIKLTNDKVKVNFLGLIPLKTVPVHKVSELEIYPGGTSVGVRLNTEGVLVVGFSDINTEKGVLTSPSKIGGVQLGDILLKVNNQNIESSKDLITKIKQSNNTSVKLEILRDNNKVTKEVNLIREGEENKLGLWVRDSTAGIGTLTFYSKDYKVFGALGHPITDGETNTTFTIKKGELLKSSVMSVRKGERGTPGELKGLFLNERESIGSILKNTNTGIYGKSNVDLTNSKYNVPMPVGFRNEIKEGKATILTTIDDEGPKEYSIEIVKLLPQDKPGSKSMVIKITDEELLSKTGGIVQGMSGSPIIQNGKIIGAVTHVLINKPDLGYGIYIEWMLKDAEILN